VPFTCHGHQACPPNGDQESSLPKDTTERIHTSPDPGCPLPLSTPLADPKAAERTAALHDAVATKSHSL